MARVLVVEDVVEVQDLVVERLRRSGHEVWCTPADPGAAVERLLDLVPDVCVVDVALPEEAGLRALRAIRGVDEGVRLIACTRAGEDVNVLPAIRSGASEVVSTVRGLQRALEGTARRDEEPGRLACA